MSKYHQDDTIHINHVTLGVSNINEALAFYQDLLKFQVIHISESEVSLTADGVTPLINLVPIKGAKKPKRHLGLYHLALLVPSRKELGKMLSHLLDSHYPLSGLSDHQVSEAIYLDDPDGNGIEIYADRYREQGYDWHAYRSDQLTMPMDYRKVLLEGENEPLESLHPNTIVGHLHLHVANIKKTETFFNQMIGFKTMFHWGDSAAFLADGNYHHHLGINTWNGLGAKPIEPDEIGLKNYTVIIPLKHKQAIVAAIIARGQQLTDANSLMISDPNGTPIYIKFQ